MLKLIIQAALVEGVLTEKVNGRQSQAALTQTALHHLKDLGTEWEGRREGGREGGEGVREGKGGRREERERETEKEGGREGGREGERGSLY